MVQKYLSKRLTTYSVNFPPALGLTAWFQRVWMQLLYKFLFFFSEKYNKGICAFENLSVVWYYPVIRGTRTCVNTVLQWNYSVFLHLFEFLTKIVFDNVLLCKDVCRRTLILWVLWSLKIALFFGYILQCNLGALKCYIACRVTVCVFYILLVYLSSHLSRVLTFCCTLPSFLVR